MGRVSRGERVNSQEMEEMWLSEEHICNGHKVGVYFLILVYKNEGNWMHYILIFTSYV